MIGRDLGHFRITAKLGEGGMGEVYRARDTRLGREVAIKVLPEAFAADLDRLARFEREAKLLASLNHPHIAAIHDLEEVEGRKLLILELVKGEALSQRLDGAPVPVAEALELARQIAGALEAAHRTGVAHRDVKPANVKVTPEGQAKVLDFGLARALPTGEATELTQSPTLTYAPTGTGVILGTVPYMSPEQARGETVGEQADIWALGCVLYEMLAGKRAFPGETSSDVLAAVLTGEPDWDALPADTPPLARSLLRRCLQKDPRRRLQDVGDARIELEEAAREPVFAATADIARARRPAISRPLLWGMSTLALVAVGLTGWLIRPVPPPPEASLPALLARFQLQPPPGVSIAESNAYSTLAISPDGRQVAFIGADASGRSLYLRALEELEARPVPGSSGAWNPFFSPDGQWLGFWARGALRKVPTSGGQPLALCDAPTLRGASWGENDTILFAVQEGLLRVPESGGEPEVVTTPDPDEGEDSHRWPQYLPGGRTALFSVKTGLVEANHRIAALSLASGEYRTVLTGGTYPSYGDGYLTFSRLGTLYAVPFDPEGLELTGEVRAVLDDLHYHHASGSAAYGVSRVGDLVFTPGAPRARGAELVAVDRRGRVSPLAERQATYLGAPSFSSDGRRFVVPIGSSPDETDLWIYDIEPEVWTRLTIDGTAKYYPIWSPARDEIVYNAAPEGALNLFRIPADGADPPERLTTGREWDLPTSISPDGRVLLFMRYTEPGQADLFTLELDGEDTPEPFLAGPRMEGSGSFSPDGRWIVYESDERGRREVFARPYPAGEPRIAISPGGGTVPVWSPRGDEIFFRCEKAICSVPVTAEGELVVGPPRPPIELDFLVRDPWQNPFTVSADGQRLYLARYLPEASPERRLVYVPRWTEELR